MKTTLTVKEKSFAYPILRKYCYGGSANDGMIVRFDSENICEIILPSNKDKCSKIGRIFQEENPKNKYWQPICLDPVFEINFPCVMLDKRDNNVYLFLKLEHGMVLGMNLKNYSNIYIPLSAIQDKNNFVTVVGQAILEF